MKSSRFVLFVVCLVTAACSQACSVCIAHMLGAALHGVGAQVLPKGKFVIGVSHLTFDKSNGTETPGEREYESYHETALGIAYGLTDRIMLSGTVPSVTKTINSPEGRESTTGIGDASIGVTIQLRPSDSNPILSALGLAVKLPTGENSRRNRDGALMEEHLQPGTGSTDVSVGYSFTKETAGFGSGLVYGGVQGRFNGKNSRGYRYGDAFFYNLGYSQPLSKNVHGALELVGRVAAKDHVGDGTMDDNSGGHLLYIGLGLTAQTNKAASLGIGVQLPLLQRLNGDQTERALFTIGFAGKF